jgi:hypothetical protein
MKKLFAILAMLAIGSVAMGGVGPMPSVSYNPATGEVSVTATELYAIVVDVPADLLDTDVAIIDDALGVPWQEQLFRFGDNPSGNPSGEILPVGLTIQEYALINIGTGEILNAFTGTAVIATIPTGLDPAGIGLRDWGAVPEPTTMALIALGGLVAIRRRR